MEALIRCVRGVRVNAVCCQMGWPKKPHHHWVKVMRDYKGGACSLQASKCAVCRQRAQKQAMGW
ncbi:hypothetical protein ASY01nite_17110 [Acetobacter syzygii]|nr:hypothetical protein AA0483_1503 [Acetobacter syzygii NRIC 0483]GEL56645.1 hypothetical protein ASY01nite_17110 [Acetobacter syzygii]